MKTLLQTLFFFLLVTQICFAQLYQQKCRMNFNNKNGRNLEAKLTHHFLAPNFQEKFLSTMGNPDLNDRFNPKTLVQNNSQNHRIFSPQALLYVIDTAIVRKMGDGINDFGDTTRHLYSYNEGGKNIIDYVQKLVGTAWLDFERETYTYDRENRMLTHLFQMLSDGQWVLFQREWWIYDEKGNLLSDSLVLWDPTTEKWLLGRRSNATYDANSNLLTWEWEGWKIPYLKPAWYLDRFTYTYDIDGNKVTELYEMGYEGLPVVPCKFYTYTYDFKGNLVSQLDEEWSNDHWVNTGRDIYTYDANGIKLAKLHECWSNAQWANCERYSYTYDGQGNNLSELYEAWDDSIQWRSVWRRTFTYNFESKILSNKIENVMWPSGQWENASLIVWTYDSNGNMLSEEFEEGQNGQWVNYWRRAYTYDAEENPTSFWYYRWENNAWVPTDLQVSRYELAWEITDKVENKYYFNGYNIDLTYKSLITEVQSEIKKIIVDFTLSQNYPNPFNPSTKISWQMPVGSQATLKVYDILGREVATLINDYKPAGKYETEFISESIPSGVYFYQLKAGEYSSVKKMILLR